MEVWDADDIKNMNNEMDKFADDNVPGLVDDCVYSLLQADGRRPRSSVFLKTTRTMLKFLLPIMKKCFHGGEPKMSYFQFALDARTYDCFRSMLDDDMANSVCFALRVVRLAGENVFVAECSKERALHTFSWDLKLHARHCVQPEKKYLVFEASSDANVELYKKVIEQNCRFMKKKMLETNMRMRRNNDTASAAVPVSEIKAKHFRALGGDDDDELYDDATTATTTSAASEKKSAH